MRMWNLIVDFWDMRGSPDFAIRINAVRPDLVF
jgi:hypothetical protein